MTESETDILAQRRQARTGKRLVDEKLLALHRATLEALLDGARSESVRQRALAQVDQWERQRLCSLCCIDAWRALLSLPLQLRAVLLRALTQRAWRYARIRRAAFS